MIGFFQAGLLFILLPYLTNFFRLKDIFRQRATDILTSQPGSDIKLTGKRRMGSQILLKLHISLLLFMDQYF